MSLPKLTTLNSQQSSNVDSSGIKVCKVTSVILDDTHKLFSELGGWNSIGTITFTFLDEVSDKLNVGSKDLKDNIAIPLNPNNKLYPLKNEIVYLIRLNTLPKSNDTVNTTWYYVTPINILNSPHQNSYVLSDSSNVKFNAVGIPFRNSQTTTNKIDLGSLFKDVRSVHPLLPFEGDLIIESRHGTYIRLGGVYNPKFKTQWESTEQANYFVISGKTNGKTDNIHVIEDINTDDYIIAGFSDHVINMLLPCTEFGSYNLNVNNIQSSPTQLYESTLSESTPAVTETSDQPINSVIPTVNTSTPSSGDSIYDSKSEIDSEEEFYNDSVGDFEKPDYIYVLNEETVNERSQIYNETPDIFVVNTNIVPVKYLSLDQLSKIVNNTTLAARYLKFVNQTLTLYKINNNQRIAGFLSQCLIESANFTRMSELGDKDYFKKYEKPGNKLGNTQPGDGYKFRGRGVIQITGRYNVTKLFTDFNISLNTNPDILASAPMNILSAGWYWNMRKLNHYADLGDVFTIRQKVQGTGTDRLSDVKREYSKIIQILSNGTA